MLGREDEDLVDAAGGGLGEDGPAVGHHEGLVTLEGRVEVGHHPDEPAPGRARRSRARAACPPRCPGRTGRADRGRRAPMACGSRRSRAARERPGLTTTQRPDNGSRRSWFIGRTLSGAVRPADSHVTSSHPSTSTVQVPPPGIGTTVAWPSPGLAGHRRTCRPCTTSRTGRPSTSCSSSTSAASWSGSSRRRRPRRPPPGCGGSSVAGARCPSPCGATSAPGSTGPGRAVYGIPVFGFALVAMSHGAYALGQAWVLGGLVLFAGVGPPGRRGAVAGRAPAPGALASAEARTPRRTWPRPARRHRPVRSWRLARSRPLTGTGACSRPSDHGDSDWSLSPDGSP